MDDDATAPVVLVALNPASGQHDADRTERVLTERLREDGAEVEVRRTEGEGDARDWAAGAGDDGVDVVVAGGGDGTVREVASGLVRAGSDVAMAILPLGTANLLARELEVPTDDVAAAAGVVTSGRERAIDVLHLVDRDEHALLMVDAGFDARLVRDASRGGKDLLGNAAYVLAGARNLFTLQEARVRLELDDEARRLWAHTVLTVNIGSVAAVDVASDIAPDDGDLDVGIVRGDQPWRAAATAARMVTRDRGGHLRVEWQRCRRVRVEAWPPLPVQVDGEEAGTTPVEVAVLPGAVRVVVPT